MWCSECGKPAVTRDGRSLCLKCLRAAIRHEVPMVGCYQGSRRTPDHKQASSQESSPWAENAIRLFEDGPA